MTQFNNFDNTQDLIGYSSDSSPLQPFGLPQPTFNRPTYALTQVDLEAQALENLESLSDNTLVKGADAFFRQQLGEKVPTFLGPESFGFSAQPISMFEQGTAKNFSTNVYGTELTSVLNNTYLTRTMIGTNLLNKDLLNAYIQATLLRLPQDELSDIAKQGLNQALGTSYRLPFQLTPSRILSSIATVLPIGPITRVLTGSNMSTNDMINGFFTEGNTIPLDRAAAKAALTPKQFNDHIIQALISAPKSFFGSVSYFTTTKDAYVAAIVNAPPAPGWTPELQMAKMKKYYKGFSELLRFNGISEDDPKLANANNMDHWYMLLGMQLSMNNAVVGLANETKVEGAWSTFFSRTVKDTFIRDAFINDPDFIIDIGVSIGLTAATGVGGGMYLASRFGLKGAKITAKGVKALSRYKKAMLVLRKARKLLPVNVGATVAEGIGNVAWRGLPFLAEAPKRGITGFLSNSLGFFASGYLGGGAAEMQNQRNRMLLQLQDPDNGFDWHTIRSTAMVSGLMAPTGNRILGVIPNFIMTHGGKLGAAGVTATTNRLGSSLKNQVGSGFMRRLHGFVQVMRLNPETIDTAILQRMVEGELGATLDEVVEWGESGEASRDVGFNLLGILLDADPANATNIAASLTENIAAAQAASESGEKIPLLDFYGIVANVFTDVGGSNTFASLAEGLVDMESQAQSALFFYIKHQYQLLRNANATFLSEKEFFEKVSKEGLGGFLQSASQLAQDIYQRYKQSLYGDKKLDVKEEMRLTAHVYGLMALSVQSNINSMNAEVLGHKQSLLGKALNVFTNNGGSETVREYLLSLETEATETDLKNATAITITIHANTAAESSVFIILDHNNPMGNITDVGALSSEQVIGLVESSETVDVPVKPASLTGEERRAQASELHAELENLIKSGDSAAILEFFSENFTKNSERFLRTTKLTTESISSPEALAEFMLEVLAEEKSGEDTLAEEATVVAQKRQAEAKKQADKKAKEAADKKAKEAAEGKTPEEEAPVEEAPIEEAPIEEAPVEEAPVEEQPIPIVDRESENLEEIPQVTEPETEAVEPGVDPETGINHKQLDEVEQETLELTGESIDKHFPDLRGNALLNNLITRVKAVLSVKSKIFSSKPETNQPTVVGISLNRVGDSPETVSNGISILFSKDGTEPTARELEEKLSTISSVRNLTAFRTIFGNNPTESTNFDPSAEVRFDVIVGRERGDIKGTETLFKQLTEAIGVEESEGSRTRTAFNDFRSNADSEAVSNQIKANRQKQLDDLSALDRKLASLKAKANKEAAPTEFAPTEAETPVVDGKLEAPAPPVETEAAPEIEAAPAETPVADVELPAAPDPIGTENPDIISSEENNADTLEEAGAVDASPEQATKPAVVTESVNIRRLVQEIDEAASKEDSFTAEETKAKRDVRRRRLEVAKLKRELLKELDSVGALKHVAVLLDDVGKRVVAFASTEGLNLSEAIAVSEQQRLKLLTEAGKAEETLGKLNKKLKHPKKSKTFRETTEKLKDLNKQIEALTEKITEFTENQSEEKGSTGLSKKLLEQYQLLQTINHLLSNVTTGEEVVKALSLLQRYKISVIDSSNILSRIKDQVGNADTAALTKSRNAAITALSDSRIQELASTLSTQYAHFANAAVKSPVTISSVLALAKAKTHNHYVLSPLLFALAEQKSSYDTDATMVTNFFSEFSKGLESAKPSRTSTQTRTKFSPVSLFNGINTLSAHKIDAIEFGEMIGREGFDVNDKQAPLDISELDNIRDAYLEHQHKKSLSLSPKNDLLSKVLTHAGAEAMDVLNDDVELLNSLDQPTEAKITERTSYSDPAQRPAVQHTVFAESLADRVETEEQIKADVDVEDRNVLYEYLTVMRQVHKGLAEYLTQETITLSEFQSLFPQRIVATGQAIIRTSLDGAQGQTSIFTPGITTILETSSVTGETQFNPARLLAITEGIIQNIGSRLHIDADAKLVNEAVAKVLGKRVSTTPSTLAEISAIAAKDADVWSILGKKLFNGEVRVRLGNEDSVPSSVKGLYPLQALLGETSVRKGPMRYSSAQEINEVTEIFSDYHKAVSSHRSKDGDIETGRQHFGPTEIMKMWEHYDIAYSNLFKGPLDTSDGAQAYRGILLDSATKYFFGSFESGESGRSGLTTREQKLVIVKLRTTLKAHVAEHPELANLINILSQEISLKSPSATEFAAIAHSLVAYSALSDLFVVDGETQDFAGLGNGNLSYNPAYQTGKAIMDFLAERSEGHVRHKIRVPKDNEKPSATKIVTPEVIGGVRTNNAVSEQLSYVHHANNFAGLRTHAIQKMKEDFLILSRIRWTLQQLKNNSLDYKAIEAWANKPKNAELFGKDRTFYRLLPTLLDPNGTSPVWSLKDQQSYMYDSLAQLPRTIMGAIHDGMVVGGRGGFVDLTLNPNLFNIPSFGFLTAVVQPFSTAHALVAAGSMAGRSNSLQHLSTISLAGWQALVTDLHAQGLDTEDVLLKTNYFDSDFNGKQHQLAIMASVMIDQVGKGIVTTADGVEHSLGDVLDTLSKGWEEVAKADLFVDPKTVDPYKITIARIIDTFAATLNTASVTTPETQQQVRGVISMLQKLELLPTDIDFTAEDAGSNFKKWLEDPEDADGMKARLRDDFFKDPIMYRIYSGGEPAITGAIKEYLSGTTFDTNEILNSQEMQNFIRTLVSTKARAGAEAIDLFIDTEGNKLSVPLLDHGLGINFSPAELLRALAVNITPAMMKAAGFEGSFGEELHANFNSRMVESMSRSLREGGSTSKFRTLHFIEQTILLKVAEKAEILGIDPESQEFKDNLKQARDRFAQGLAYMKAQGINADTVLTEQDAEHIAVLELIVNGIDPAEGEVMKRWQSLTISQQAVDVLSRVGVNFNPFSAKALSSLVMDKYVDHMDEEQTFFMAHGLTPVNMRMQANKPSIQGSTLSQLVRNTDDPKTNNPWGMWKLASEGGQVPTTDEIQKLILADLLLRSANMSFTEADNTPIDIFSELGFEQSSDEAFFHSFLEDSNVMDIKAANYRDNKIEPPKLEEAVSKALAPVSPLQRYAATMSQTGIAASLDNNEDVVYRSDTPSGIFSLMPLHTGHNIFTALGVPFLRAKNAERAVNQRDLSVNDAEVNRFIQNDPSKGQFTYEPSQLPVFTPPGDATNINYGTALVSGESGRFPFARAQRLKASLDAFANEVGLLHLLPNAEKSAQQTKDDLLKLYFWREIDNVTQKLSRNIQTLLDPNIKQRIMVDGSFQVADPLAPDVLVAVQELVTAEFTGNLLNSIQHYLSSKFTVTSLASMFPNGKIPAITKNILTTTETVEVDGKLKKVTRLSTMREISTKVADRSNNLFSLNPNKNRTNPSFAPTLNLVATPIANGPNPISVFRGASGSATIPVSIHANESSMMSLIILIGSKFKNWRDNGVVLDGLALSSADVESIMRGDRFLTSEEINIVNAELNRIREGQGSLSLTINIFEEAGIQLALDTDAGGRKTLRLLPNPGIRIKSGGVEVTSRDDLSTIRSNASSLSATSIQGTGERVLLTSDLFSVMLSDIGNAEFIDRLRIAALTNSMNLTENIASERLKDMRRDVGITNQDSRQNAHDDAKAMDFLAQMYAGTSEGYERITNLNALGIHQTQPATPGAKTEPKAFQPLVPTPIISPANNLGFAAYYQDVAEGVLSLGLKSGLITQEPERLSEVAQALAGFFHRVNADVEGTTDSLLYYAKILFPNIDFTENLRLLYTAQARAVSLRRITAILRAERDGFHARNPFIDIVASALLANTRKQKAILSSALQTGASSDLGTAKQFIFSEVGKTMHEALDADIQLLITDPSFAPIRAIMEDIFGFTLNPTVLMANKDLFLSGFRADTDALTKEKLSEKAEKFRQRLKREIISGFIANLHMLSDSSSHLSKALTDASKQGSSSDTITASASPKAFGTFLDNVIDSNDDANSLRQKIALPLQEAVRDKLLTEEQARVLRYIISEQVAALPGMWRDTQLMFVESPEHFLELSVLDSEGKNVLDAGLGTGTSNAKAIAERLKTAGALFVNNDSDNTEFNSRMLIIKTGNKQISNSTLLHVILHEMSHLFENSVDSIVLSNLKTELVKVYRGGKMPKLLASLVTALPEVAKKQGDVGFIDSLTNNEDVSSELFANLFPVLLLSRIPSSILNSLELTEVEKEALDAFSKQDETKFSLDMLTSLMIRVTGRDSTMNLYGAKVKAKQLQAIFPELGSLFNALFEISLEGVYTETTRPASIKAIQSWEPNTSVVTKLKETIARKQQVNRELGNDSISDKERADLKSELTAINEHLKASGAANPFGVRYVDYFKELEQLRAGPSYNAKDDTWNIYSILENPRRTEIWISWVFENLNEYLGNVPGNPISNVLNSIGLSAESSIGLFLRRFLTAPSNSDITYDSTIGAVVLLSGFVADDFRLTSGILQSKNTQSLKNVRSIVFNSSASAKSEVKKLLSTVTGNSLNFKRNAAIAKDVHMMLRSAILFGDVNHAANNNLISKENAELFKEHSAAINAALEGIKFYFTTVHEATKAGGLMPKERKAILYPLKTPDLLSASPEAYEDLSMQLRQKIGEHLLNQAHDAKDITDLSPTMAYALGLFPNLQTREQFRESWKTFSVDHPDVAEAIGTHTSKLFQKVQGKGINLNTESLYVGAKDFFRKWEHYSLTDTFDSPTYKSKYQLALGKFFDKSIELSNTEETRDRMSSLVTATAKSNLLGRRAMHKAAVGLASDPLGLLVARFLSSTGTGSFFTLDGHREFPGLQKLMYDKSNGKVTESKLSTMFESNLEELIDGLEKSVHFDGEATKSLMNFTKTPGLTFPDLLGLIIRAAEGGGSLALRDASNGGRASDSKEFIRALKYLQQVYTYTGGRRKSYDEVKDHPFFQAINPHAREVTVLALGSNLLLAGLAVETPLNFLNTVLAPGQLSQPIRAIADALAFLPFTQQKEASADMAYGHYYGQAMNMRGLDWSAIEELRNGRKDSLLSKILGPGVSTTLATSLTLNRRLRTAQSAVFKRRFMHRWKKGQYQDFAKLYAENPPTTMQELADLGRLAGIPARHRVELLHLQTSNIMNYIPELTFLLQDVGAVPDYRILLTEVIYPAINTTAPGSAEHTQAIRLREAIDAMRVMEDKHLESVFVSSHPLDADLNDHGIAFLWKHWRQYQTSYAAQRIRRDSQIYSPEVWAARQLVHILGDSVYMFLLRVAGGVAMGDELERIRENPVLSILTYVARTPWAGFYGTVISEALVRMVGILSGTQQFTSIFPVDAIPVAALEKLLRPIFDLGMLARIHNDPQGFEHRFELLKQHVLGILPGLSDRVFILLLRAAGALPDIKRAGSGSPGGGGSGGFSSMQATGHPIAPHEKTLLDFSRMMQEYGYEFLAGKTNSLPLTPEGEAATAATNQELDESIAEFNGTAAPSTPETQATPGTQATPASSPKVPTSVTPTTSPASIGSKGFNKAPSSLR